MSTEIDTSQRVQWSGEVIPLSRMFDFAALNRANVVLVAPSMGFGQVYSRACYVPKTDCFAVVADLEKRAAELPAVPVIVYQRGTDGAWSRGSFAEWKNSLG